MHRLFDYILKVVCLCPNYFFSGRLFLFVCTVAGLETIIAVESTIRMFTTTRDFNNPSML